MSGEPDSFDLAAAWLRKASGDMRAFTEALATRLSSALPDSVDVERRRDGLFSSTSHVTRIVVRLEGSALTLDVEHGHLRARRAKVVRGVTISSEEIAVPVWLDEVVRGTRAHGEAAGAAHGVLHEFLMS
jgi:hypothetical protein